MSDVKWIKIVTDIFDNRKIRQIESMPDGDAIIVIWFKILCLAGTINEDGKLYITPDIPYTEQTLATQFCKPLTTIQFALKVLSQYGMIEIFDDVLMVSNWEKYQNVDAMERVREQNRIRKQNQRNREKLALEDSVSRDTSRDVTEQNKNKNKKEEYIRVNTSINSSSETKEVSDIVEEWNRLSDLGIPTVSRLTSSSKRYEGIRARVRQYGKEKVIEAIGNIRESDFLQGKNHNGWTITFDWFILPNNFPKVLDGNYANRDDGKRKNDDAFERWVNG